jgi:arylsulfatase A-like enzyme
MTAGIHTYLHPTTFSLSHGEVYPQFPAGDVRIADRALEDLLLPTFGLPGSLFFALAYRIKDLHRETSGLEDFDALYPRGIPALNAYNASFLVEDVVRGMTSRLAEARQPFLAYLHFYPPHDPYRARREFVDVFRDGWKPATKTEHLFSQGHSQEHLNEQRARYDEYIAHTDAEFGRMVGSLDGDGLLDNSYVIFTSDHGELFERGVRGHSTPLLYEPVIRVPLLVSAPGQSQRRDVHVPTSCVDLLPTLLHLTDQSVPDWCEGQLLPELGGDRDPDRVVFSVEAKENAMNRPLTRATVAMIRGTYKLIHYIGYQGYQDEYELYDLENDPEELEDLYSPTNPVAADMQTALRAKLQEVDRPYQ